MTIDQAVSIGRRARIDRRIYRDPAILELELAKLFARTWQYVGFESDIPNPGDFRAVTVGTQPIVVTRDKGGAIHAFPNTCTHRGSLLATTESGNCGSVLKCMYHGWSFDLSGRCIGVPYPSAYGDGFDRSEFDISPVRVEVRSGMVFVNLDPEAPSLTEYLGGAATLIDEYCAGMEVIGRIHYIFSGNWKAWHENFSDGYHPDFAHRWVHNFQSTYPGEGINEDLGNGHSILTWRNDPPDFERYNDSLGAVSGLEHHTEAAPLYQVPDFAPLWEPTSVSRVWALFPNVDFQSPFRTPCIEILHPRAVDRTLVEVVFLGAVTDTPEQRQWRLDHVGSLQASSGKVAADDNEAIQRCQAGFAARTVTHSDMSRGQADGPVGDTRDDHGLRGFYREWKRYLGFDLDTDDVQL